LFQIRDDYRKNLAGDSIQMMKTREYLQKLGVKVDISSQYGVNLEKYDIVHIFNLMRAKEPYRFAQNAMDRKKPYVLSTIYWTVKSYENDGSNANISGLTSEWWSKYNRARSELLSNASALLPNSHMEMRIIERDFSITKKYFVVPNCSDRAFYNAAPDRFISEYGLKDFVLCVGRISYRKNQLSLIKALKDTNLRLVLIGPKSNDDYFEACKKHTDGKVLFIDKMQHNELGSAYAAAKVHVLPSWFETPGLTSLEAGLAGCNIVTTEKGSTREYFKDLADYCSPSSPESIRKAVINAYNKPRNNKLRNHILRNYTWETAAQKTLEAYEYVLNNGR